MFCTFWQALVPLVPLSFLHSTAIKRVIGQLDAARRKMGRCRRVTCTMACGRELAGASREEKESARDVEDHADANPKSPSGAKLACEKVGHARKRGDPTTSVTTNMETLLQFISVKARRFKRGSRSRNNSGRHSTDPFDVRSEARHLWAAHSVVTSFAGGYHQVSRIFTLWALASSASPTRGGLLFPYAGQQSSTVAPPTDTRSRVRSQESEVQSRKSKVGSPKSEVQSRKSKVGSPKSEVQSRKSKGPKVPKSQGPKVPSKQFEN